MKFTQPVSMQCSQEQYERDLKEPLEKLGYPTNNVKGTFTANPLLVSNFDYDRGIGNLDLAQKDAKQRHFIDHYNPQLFLSLSSMTDEPNGIVGEWFVNNNLTLFLTKDASWGVSHQGRKATKEELINHFTKTHEKEGIKSEEKAAIHSSPVIQKILNRDKNFAEISLRIEGVLTRFIAESEYQRVIDDYESKLKEVQSSMYKIMEAVAKKEKEEKIERDLSFAESGYLGNSVHKKIVFELEARACNCEKELAETESERFKLSLKVEELEEKIGKQNVAIVNHLARVSKIKEICND